MHSQFEFSFTAQSISFRERHLLKGQLEVLPLSSEVHVDFSPASAECYVMEIEIVASPHDAKSGCVSGKVLILLPGQPRDVAWLARSLADDLEQHIKFFYSDFKLLRGLLAARRIPDTDEEAAEIGDRPYWAEMNLVEVSAPRPFSDEVLRAFPVSFQLRRLVGQYNQSNAATNLIDTYLSRFKVLESAFHRGSGKARAVLKSNSDFRALLASEVSISNLDGASSTLNDTQIDELVDNLVTIRDKCAHLREQNNFGYAPTDPEVLKEVRPWAEMLDSLARRTIILEYRRLGAEVFDSLCSAQP